MNELEAFSQELELTETYQLVKNVCGKCTLFNTPLPASCVL